MKTGAIICEYNPLHNGHQYQIQQTKNTGITHLIGILSDDFVQRGETAILNKFERAELALKAGMDLIIELPMPYSCASAECYARGAVQLLKHLNCIEILSFGSSANSETLQQLSELVIQAENSSEIQAYLKAGRSYPSAIFQAVAERNPESAKLLLDPNNLLALEYLKSIKKLNANIQPLAIARTSVLHDSTEVSDNFASASLIRQKIALHEDYQHYVPDFTAELLKNANLAEFSKLEQIILYQIRRLSKQELSALPDMTPELARRFLKAKTANSLETLLNAVKSKNFTMARIKRIFIYALTGIQKKDLHTAIPYARVLGFNQRGTELLKLIRKKSQIPIDTSLAKLKSVSPEAERFAEIQTNSANLYGLAQQNYTSAELEFRMKIKLYQN